MATTKIFVFLFAILVPSTIILAQENTEAADFSGPPGHDTTSEVAASELAGHVEFKPGHFHSSFPGSFRPDTFLSGAGSRHKRSAEESSEIEEHPREKRAVVNCNYAKQGGYRCTSCTVARRCYRMGKAIVTKCSGATPYCNNGFCSRTKGSMCTATTSSSSTTSTTTSSSTSSNTSSASSTSSNTGTSSSASSNTGSTSQTSSSTDSNSDSSSSSGSSSSGSSSSDSSSSSSDSSSSPSDSSSSSSDSSSSSSQP